MSMERLTFDGNFCDIAQCRELPCPYNNACTQRQVWEKLKAYEDLEHAPEKYARVFSEETVLRMAACVLGAAPEWLRKVVALGRAGRLVALNDKLRICGEGESDDDKR